MPLLFVRMAALFTRMAVFFTRMAELFVRMAALFTGRPMSFVGMPSLFVRISTLFVRISILFLRRGSRLPMAATHFARRDNAPAQRAEGRGSRVEGLPASSAVIDTPLQCELLAEKPTRTLALLLPSQ